VSRRSRLSYTKSDCVNPCISATPFLVPKSFVNFNVTHELLLLPSIESEPFLHTPRFHVSSRAAAAGTTFYQPSRMLPGQGWWDPRGRDGSRFRKRTERRESCFHFPCLFLRHNFRTDLPLMYLLSPATLHLENLEECLCRTLC
jgi:hypothetical protein